jgi:hypothetical protein
MVKELAWDFSKMVEELAWDFSKIKDAKSIVINDSHEISSHWR